MSKATLTIVTKVIMNQYNVSCIALHNRRNLKEKKNKPKINVCQFVLFSRWAFNNNKKVYEDPEK